MGEKRRISNLLCIVTAEMSSQFVLPSYSSKSYLKFVMSLVRSTSPWQPNADLSYLAQFGGKHTIYRKYCGPTVELHHFTKGSLTGL